MAFKLDKSKHTHRIRSNPDAENSKAIVHPNSLVAKTIDDPDLARKYRDWSREFEYYLRDMEGWAANGFQP
jgi:hypothetical protein